MKKLAVVAMVLVLTNIGSAALTLHVTDCNGDNIPPCLMPGDVVMVSLSNDSVAAIEAGFACNIGIDGGIVDVSGATCPTGAVITDFTGMDGFSGQTVVTADCALLSGRMPPLSPYLTLPAGTIISGIRITIAVPAYWDPVSIFPSEGANADPRGTFDPVTLVIIPEPMTLGFLGLGGLFLRRRLA